MNALVAIPDIMEDAVEPFFQAAPLSAQGRSCTVIYDAKELVIIYEIRAGMFGQTIRKRVYKYFQAVKAAEELRKRLLCLDDLLG